MVDTIVPYRRYNSTSFAGNMVRRLYRGTPLNARQTLDSMRALARRSRMRRPGGRAETMTRRGRRSSAGTLGGTNADMRSIYRRKRMPRKKRKRWVRFVRKVHAVADKELGTRTVLFNDQITQRNTNSSNQSTLSLALYSFANTTGYLNDLYQIGQLENEGDPSAADGATINRNSKVMFQSAIMDITIRNISDKLTSVDPGNPILNTYSAAPEAAIELDIYEVMVNRELTDVSLTFRNLSQVFNVADDPEIGGTGNGIYIESRGASPFEFGAQMGRRKVKILKKTKFFIPNGQTITWQVRDPKRRTIQYGDLEREESYNRPGWTKHFFLIYKLVPGLSQGNTLGDIRPSIAVGCTRKYAYKVEGFNEPRERLLGSTYVTGHIA